METINRLTSVMKMWRFLRGMNRILKSHLDQFRKHKMLQVVLVKFVIITVALDTRVTF